MNNKEQSAETTNEQSTEAQVTMSSHSNGNTPVVCCICFLLLLPLISCAPNTVGEKNINSFYIDSLRKLDKVELGIIMSNIKNYNGTDLIYDSLSGEYRLMQ
jgi:hypothetical protein